ncbi:RDD family protein [Humibacter sp. RRB41]|uniref:RDD family protein n=1 Tax=Humibacter sp. RRB41 TaxID=2919946 RepID=UPI001FA9477E|nr:RDD family protein [Humibacter sp. RRB41]
MHRHPWRRLLAWLIDWVCVLVWVGILVAIGVPLYLSGVTGGVGPISLNVISGLVLVVPVTVVLAALEASRSGATLGKRVLHLRVQTHQDARVSFGRALARNALKIALPWAVGHVAVIAIVVSSEAGSVPPWVWVVTIAAYVLPIAYVVALFVRSGRTPYDAAAGTSVVLAAQVGSRAPR